MLSSARSASRSAASASISRKLFWSPGVHRRSAHHRGAPHRCRLRPFRARYADCRCGVRRAYWKASCRIRARVSVTSHLSHASQVDLSSPQCGPSSWRATRTPREKRGSAKHLVQLLAVPEMHLKWLFGICWLQAAGSRIFPKVLRRARAASGIGGGCPWTLRR